MSLCNSLGRLADWVEVGIRAMIKDGSFDAIFKKYKAALIKRAHLSDRRVIHINNPNFPREPPLADRTLWFSKEVGKWDAGVSKFKLAEILLDV